MYILYRLTKQVYEAVQEVNNNSIGLKISLNVLEEKSQKKQFIHNKGRVITKQIITITIIPFLFFIVSKRLILFVEQYSQAYYTIFLIS